MSPKVTRTDIYNLKEIADRLKDDGVKNAYENVQLIFKDIDALIDKRRIPAIIKLLEAEHKATIARLKSKLKNA